MATAVGGGVVSSMIVINYTRRSGVGNRNATFLRGVSAKITYLAEKKRPPNFIDLAGHRRQIRCPPDFISRKTRFGSRLERRISPKTKQKKSGGFTAVTHWVPAVNQLRRSKFFFGDISLV